MPPFYPSNLSVLFWTVYLGVTLWPCFFLLFRGAQHQHFQTSLRRWSSSLEAVEVQSSDESGLIKSQLIAVRLWGRLLLHPQKRREPTARRTETLFSPKNDCFDFWKLPAWLISCIRHQLALPTAGVVTACVFSFSSYCIMACCSQQQMTDLGV